MFQARFELNFHVYRDWIKLGYVKYHEDIYKNGQCSENASYSLGGVEKLPFDFPIKFHN